MFRLRLSALLLIILLTACSPQRSTVVLAVLGDVMVGRGVAATPDSFSYIAPQLKAADLSLANLESPLSSRADMVQPAGAAYNLCAPAGRAALLPVWGLDMLSLANNHRLDCGPDGVAASAQALQAAGVTPLGPGFEPVDRTINGLKLAFLAFDDSLAPLDADAAVRSIRSARSTGALVVVMVHWGMEYQGGPSLRQESLARQFAAAGAALIVGAHPHVLQRADWIAAGQGRALVFYSLGNALFDQYGLPATRQSALLLVTLNASGVRSVQVLPFEIDVRASRLVAPDGAAAARIRSLLTPQP
ncbi:MAG TPA: CapA family protein [Anaerolineales bacterium]|nr:CapA family protein [Anaerolineales bacterium]